jgi:hypothetical protein
MEKVCKRHGLTKFTPTGRCNRCLGEAVTRRRRKVKQILVAEHGGICKLCGYNRCIAALQFHHIDPTTKKFGIAAQGFTRSLEKSREEAEKCILLCSNCHVEVEQGVAFLGVR